MSDDSRNNATKTGPGNPPVEHQFKPGNPGRPKGSRNKLGEAFIEDIYARWQDKGIEVIDEVIRDRPHEFLKVVAGILPKELKITNESELTDEQLIERIRQLDTVIRPFLSAEGAGDSGGRDKPKALPN